MISRLLCPTGKSHSLPLWHLIHDHCLFANAFASLGCSRISFTFYLSSCFIGLFLCVWCGSSTSYFCTRPQVLVYKPRTSPEHQLWFMALKSHFYADVSEISIFIPDPLSWRVFTWVSENSETQHVWSPQYFLPNCYTQLPLSQLVTLPTLWSNSHRTTGKTTALTLWTFGSKGMFLLFNTLSRLLIAFLPKSRCLLISWLQSLSTMILVLKKRKSITASTLPPSICHKMMGLDAMIFGSVS